MNPLLREESERKLYERLETSFGKDLAVFAHVPVRKVFDDAQLADLNLTPEERVDLLGSDFHYVIADGATLIPIMAVELDNVSHGFSREGKYVRVTRLDPEIQTRSLELKLRAEVLTDLPIVVVSFDEIMPLRESGDTLTVIEAIIGKVLAYRRIKSDLAGQDWSDDPREAVEDVLLAIEVGAGLEKNPVRARTAEMLRKLPSLGRGFEFLRDRKGYVGSGYYFFDGIEIKGGRSRTKILLGVSVYLREVSCLGVSPEGLLECIGEYSLAHKALEEIWEDPGAWDDLIKDTPWTED